MPFAVTLMANLKEGQSMVEGLLGEDIGRKWSAFSDDNVHGLWVSP